MSLPVDTSPVSEQTGVSSSGAGGSTTTVIHVVIRHPEGPSVTKEERGGSIRTDSYRIMVGKRRPILRIIPQPVRTYIMWVWEEGDSGEGRFVSWNEGKGPNSKPERQNKGLVTRNKKRLDEKETTGYRTSGGETIVGPSEGDFMDDDVWNSYVIFSTSFCSTIHPQDLRQDTHRVEVWRGPNVDRRQKRKRGQE